MVPKKSANAAVPAGGAAPGPCQMMRVGRLVFQVTAKPMPDGTKACSLSIKLCEDGNGAPSKSTFNTVTVRSLLSTPPTVVPGQPSSMTGITFALKLPPGSYYIGMVVNPYPGSAMAYVFEDCTGSNQLTDIQLDIQQPTAFFSLTVV